MIRVAIVERRGSGAGQPAHQATVKPKRYEAIRPVSRATRPDIVKARQGGRAQGIEVADHHVELVMAVQQVAELAPVGQLAMVQMHVRHLQETEAYDKGNTGGCDTKNRDWQVEPGGRRQRYRGSLERLRAPGCRTVIAAGHRPANVVAANQPRQRVNRSRRFLQQHEIRTVPLDQAAYVRHACASYFKKVPAQDAHQDWVAPLSLVTAAVPAELPRIL